MITFTSLAGLGGIAGLSSHWLYFIHGEHHREGPFIIPIAVSALLLSFYGLTEYHDVDAATAIQLIGIATSSYVTALTISIVTYRLLFHRLRSYPGPFWAKVTKLYHAYVCTQESNFRLRAQWHNQYGPVVRVGPNEISVLHPAAVQEIYGVRSRCEKAPWYDMARPDLSLQTTRDKALHDSRRRIWDRGFSAKALRDFEKRQLVYVQQLADFIDKQIGKEVNISKVFNYFSFDVMGELAFGKSFDNLKSGQGHPAIDMLHHGQKNLSVVTPLPWLTPILKAIPGALHRSKMFQKWCDEQVEQRRQTKPESPDVMTWLLEESESSSKGSAAGKKWLSGDSRLIIVAGSDTTAVTLVHIFYYLAKHPEQLQKLRSVLDPIMLGKPNISNQDLQDIGHLNGIINEALRLHPPVPSGVLRVTPPEGIKFGDHFIPGGTTVSVPYHPLGRSELAYGKPLEFIPERWYSQPELVRDKNAFIPFSIGRYSCIGKSLAMMELRAVVATLATRYDITPAAGEDGSALVNGCLDAFTLFIEPYRLVFNKRQHA